MKKWNSKSGNTNTITNNREEEAQQISDYLSEIAEYIGHIEEKYSVEKENARRYYALEHRCNELYKGICTTIENNKHKEIIPIYRNVKQARLPWIRISEILKSIESKYKNRFIVTETCLIAKSKAKVLKKMLEEEPLCEKGCSSLIKSGVPQTCIARNLGDFLDKLGFGTRFDNDSNIESESNSEYCLKHNVLELSD